MILYDGISSNNYDKIQRSEAQRIVGQTNINGNRLTAFNVKEPRHYLEIGFINQHYIHINIYIRTAEGEGGQQNKLKPTICVCLGHFKF